MHLLNWHLKSWNDLARLGVHMHYIPLKDITAPGFLRVYNILVVINRIHRLPRMTDSRHIRPVVFGEVLFDKFPDGSHVAGGAPFNVAWHLQAFDANPLFISRVGNDPLGRQIRDQMRAWHMDTSGLQLDSGHLTGTVDVTIDNNEPHYEIVDQRAYDFIDAEFIPPLPESGVLYHGTLALRNTDSAATLNQLLRVSSLPVFIDINLRPPWWNRDQIGNILEHCRWLKLNVDELTLLFPDTDTRDGLQILFDRYPIEYIILTSGEKGALIADKNQNEYSVSPTKGTVLVDTVGAGDAFSSIILLGEIRKWPINLTLERAQMFASAIVGTRGATVNNKNFYQPFIENWEL